MKWGCPEDIPVRDLVWAVVSTMHTQVVRKSSSFWLSLSWSILHKTAETQGIPLLSSSLHFLRLAVLSLFSLPYSFSRDVAQTLCLTSHHCLLLLIFVHIFSHSFYAQALSFKACSVQHMLKPACLLIQTLQWSQLCKMRFLHCLFKAYS